MTTCTSTPGGTSVGSTVGSSSSTTTPTNQAALCHLPGVGQHPGQPHYGPPRPPPQIKRQGMLRPSCIVYHVKGQCHGGCTRRYDHAPCTPAEDNALLTWVGEAYNKVVGTNSTTSN
jgi:hypothetical protein